MIRMSRSSVEFQLVDTEFAGAEEGECFAGPRGRRRLVEDDRLFVEASHSRQFWRAARAPPVPS